MVVLLFFSSGGISIIWAGLWSSWCRRWACSCWMDRCRPALRYVVAIHTIRSLVQYPYCRPALLYVAIHVIRSLEKYPYSSTKLSLVQLYCDMDKIEPYLGTVQAHPGSSCRENRERSPSLPSGYYWVKPGNEPSVQVYCDMSRTCGGIPSAIYPITKPQCTVDFYYIRTFLNLFLELTFSLCKI